MKHQLYKLFMMACYMYITIKYMKLKTSVVYVHSVALKVKFEERKGDKGFKNKCFEVVIRLYKSRCLGNFLTKVTDDMLSGSRPNSGCCQLVLKPLRRELRWQGNHFSLFNYLILVYWHPILFIYYCYLIIFFIFYRILLENF